MNQQIALTTAVEAFGGKGAMASALGVTYTAVLSWLATESPNARPLPLERAMQIERLLSGAVTREALRPDVDWSRPEISDPTGSEGTPIPPAATTAPALDARAA